jgi:hypothetical protein
LVKPLQIFTLLFVLSLANDQLGWFISVYVPTLHNLGRSNYTTDISHTHPTTAALWAALLRAQKILHLREIGSINQHRLADHHQPLNRELKRPYLSK